MPTGRGDRSDLDERSGSNGIGLVVGGIAVAFFATLPFIVVTALYLFVMIYAIVRAIGPGMGENAVTIVVGFVLLTSVFVILLAVTINVVGRSLTPERSHTRD